MTLSDFQTVSFSAGETIFREGEQGDCSYVVISGDVSVHKRREDKQIKLAELGPNQMIGEMGLVSPGHRTASVTAITDCKLLLIEQSQFTRRRNELDPVMKMVFDVILTRFRNTLHSMGNEDYDSSADTYVTSEMAKALSQLQLESDIRRGISVGEFELHYQPIVCLKTGKLSGAEGLMRWNHPARGLVSPSEFIPTAEAGNLIFDLTEVAIDQACQELQEFNIASLKNIDNNNPLFVTLNVSGRDLEHDRFYDRVCRNLTDHGLQPGSLKLEVTETSLMNDVETCRDKLGHLKERGVGIAIDDFGTGYSSMSYLAKLPLSTLKIDRSFIVEMTASSQSRRIVKAILRLADELDLTVVAEGIESGEEASYLRDLKCTYGQGFLYSEAVPLSQFTKLIRNWNSHKEYENFSGKAAAIG